MPTYTVQDIISRAELMSTDEECRAYQEIIEEEKDQFAPLDYAGVILMLQNKMCILSWNELSKQQDRLIEAQKKLRQEWKWVTLATVLNVVLFIIYFTIK